jgi:phage tail-like protein
MRDPEYRELRIAGDAQWKSSGLLCRLALDAGSLSLFARPAFQQWVTPPDWRGSVTDIVLDECGQVYWLAADERGWALFRHDPASGLTERVIGLGLPDAIHPGRLWLAPTLLWIFDFHARRALALARDTFQVLHEIETGPGLVGVAFDGRGAFSTIERQDGVARLCRYVAPPDAASPECVPLDACREPAALAVARSGDAYIYCADIHRLMRVRGTDRQQEPVGSRAIDALRGFRTADAGTPMEVDGRGVIYLASRTEPVLHQFDPSGSYLGAVRLPREIRSIVGIGFDAGDNLYLATDRGVARFSLALSEVGESGVFYTRTLDSGTPRGPWHRIALAADLPERTSIEVRYHASDDGGLKRAVDDVFASDRPDYEKCERIEQLFGPLWAQPADVFQPGRDDAVQSRDEQAMLVTANRGRYLWLRIALATFDEAHRPALRSVRVLYPRSSYLRYLPAPYREDEVYSAFLERFLALFETVFHGLDREIDLLYRLFDPLLAPPEFLPWLASWVSLAIEDDMPRERARRLIARAPSLFRRKGTPAALAELLEIHTGRQAFVAEDASRVEPMVLGSGTAIGRQTVLLGSAVRGFRVGDTSVVGRAALRDHVGRPEEPFLPLAGRFTVWVEMPREEFISRRRTLERLVDQQKPAHTECVLRLVGDRGFVGGAVLEAGAAVTERQPFRVGVSPLGADIAAAAAPGLRLERGAWAGSEAGLA